jgi:Tol biopolymer transport system component
MRSLFVAVLALMALAPAADATFPGRNGRIAFTVPSSSPPERCLDGIHADCQRFWSDIFTMSPTGRKRAQLTENSSVESGYSVGAKWSPDGRRLAYDDGNQILVARADGTHSRSVAVGSHPAWSPDGREIAFVAPDPDGGSDTGIWRLDLGTGTRKQVTDGPEDLSPDWSRKGVIAFRRGFQRDDDYGNVFTVRPDGSGLTRLTGPGGDGPSWSPDGRRLLFTRGDQLRVIGAAGGRSRAIRVPQASHAGAVWSPDGRLIAVNGFQGRITVARLSGKVVRTIGPRRSYASSWQPLPR